LEFLFCLQTKKRKVLLDGVAIGVKKKEKKGMEE
jgi:hypothetical protein